MRQSNTILWSFISPGIEAAFQQPTKQPGRNADLKIRNAEAAVADQNTTVDLDRHWGAGQKVAFRPALLRMKVQMRLRR